MNIKYKSLKNTEAITLIALVITIILILILAGISITMLSGDNGIINKAIESKDNTNIKQEIEKIQLAVMGSINEDRIIHADDLKKSLQGIVEDATAIKENAPWVVNGKDTGKKYIIKLNGTVIEFPNNTGTATEMNVKDGDYINYSSGNWTENEINEMGKLYSGEKIPDSSKEYTFGGYKIGQSKDEGIFNESEDISALDSEHKGWRVLSFNEDGSIKIIHAGTPEYYYHPTWYKYISSAEYNTYKSSYRSLYILSGERKVEDEILSNEQLEDAYEGAIKKNWKVYEDELFAIPGSAHLAKIEDVATTYRGPTDLWYRKCGFNYWICHIYPSAGGIFYNVGETGSTNGYARGRAVGIRPVLTIKSGILFHNKSNTESHDNPDNAWEIIL